MCLCVCLVGVKRDGENKGGMKEGILTRERNYEVSVGRQSFHSLPCWRMHLLAELLTILSLRGE